jgi:hypothetical protein
MSRVVGGLLACVLPLVLACGTDDPRPGLRGTCGHGGGTLLGCEPEPVVDAESACWRLVDCGVIPVRNEDRFDWSRCVRFIEGLTAERYDFALACVEHAHCDDLWFPGSPDRPTTNRRDFPACLNFGDQ